MSPSLLTMNWFQVARTLAPGFEFQRFDVSIVPSIVYDCTLEQSFTLQRFIPVYHVPVLRLQSSLQRKGENGMEAVACKLAER